VSSGNGVDSCVVDVISGKGEVEALKATARRRKRSERSARDRLVACQVECPELRAACKRRRKYLSIQSGID
jgi:hypothetical protein